MKDKAPKYPKEQKQKELSDVHAVLLLICFAMAELPHIDRDPSWRRLQRNSMNFILLFSTIHLNLTLALVREISICSVFLLQNNLNNANPLLNRPRKFASDGSVYGGELPRSYFFSFLHNSIHSPMSNLFLAYWVHMH